MCRYVCLTTPNINEKKQRDEHTKFTIKQNVVFVVVFRDLHLSWQDYNHSTKRAKQFNGLGALLSLFYFFIELYFITIVIETNRMEMLTIHSGRFFHTAFFLLLCMLFQFFNTFIFTVNIEVKNMLVSHFFFHCRKSFIFCSFSFIFPLWKISWITFFGSFFLFLSFLLFLADLFYIVIISIEGWNIQINCQRCFQVFH